MQQNKNFYTDFQARTCVGLTYYKYLFLGNYINGWIMMQLYEASNCKETQLSSHN